MPPALLLQLQPSPSPKPHLPPPPPPPNNTNTVIKINNTNRHHKPSPCPPHPHLIAAIPPPAPTSANAVATTEPGLLFRQKLVYLEHDLRIDASRALSLNPSLRSAPISSIHSVVSFLSSYRIPPSDSSRIFQMYPNLLTCHPQSDLLPVLDFLQRSVGIPFHDLRKCVLRCPRLLVSSVPLQLRPAFYFLRRLGFRLSPHTTLLLVSDVENTLLPKLHYIQSLGFSYRDTVKMLLRSPGLLTFSIENNFKPKVDFLLNDMGRDVAELKDFPQYFSFSLEAKIKPRHQALLDAGLDMGLADMLKVSDGEFQVRLLEMRLKAAEEGKTDQ